jgi:hypothetical protein
MQWLSRRGHFILAAPEKQTKRFTSIVAANPIKIDYPSELSA